MIQALQLILALSLLILIHELGHFTFARIFHVRVEKFYMFFNPRFSLIRAKKINGKWHVRWFAPNLEPAAVEATDPATGAKKLDKKGNPVLRPMTDDELQQLDDTDWRKYPDNTEWGIGWLPFGGYCAIGGMVDETKSATDLPTMPQPWEFRSKPAWQRLLIILGGILVNFIAAMCLFVIITWHYGTSNLPLSNLTHGLYYHEMLLNEGFEQGDLILTVNGEEPENLPDVMQRIIIEGCTDVRVLRGQDTIALTMSPDLGTRYLALQNEHDRQEREHARRDSQYQKRRLTMMAPAMPFVIDSVMPDNAAYFTGLQSGDSIVGIAGTPCCCQVEATLLLQQHPCDSISIAYYRQGVLDTVRTFIGDQCMLGVTYLPMNHYYTYEHTDYTFLQAIPAGLGQGWDILTMYVKQFRLVFTREGAQSLGGFGAIGGMFPSVWDWGTFWSMTAFLSLILAFMNFLPIPALDGGYVLFLLVEIITRRKPSERFLEIANEVGFWLLLALLIFANGNDIFKIFF